MIKTILFDSGGVIVKYTKDLHPSLLAKLFSISLEEAKEIWFQRRNAILIGEISTKDFLRNLKQELGSRLSEDKLFTEWVKLYTNDLYEIDQEVIELIKKIAKNYKVYLLTNILDTTGHHKVHLYISKFFHGVFRSYELKLIKPDKKIFLYVLNKTNSSPNETVFIDDKEKNITAAIDAGLKGLLYINNNQLKKDLKKLGVKF